MTPYEFVFFLYAIMVTLALTHLVGGWAQAVRAASAIRWSAPYVLWCVAILGFTTGNLTSFWQMRDAQSWSAGLVLFNFFFAIVNYLVCVFIVPDAQKDEILDLPAFHLAERRRYLGAMLVLETSALAGNLVNGLYASYDNWLHDFSLSFVLIALTVSGFVAKDRLIATVSACGSAAIGIYAMIASSAIPA